jgi:hypothetical protein
MKSNTTTPAIANANNTAYGVLPLFPSLTGTKALPTFICWPSSAKLLMATLFLFAGMLTSQAQWKPLKGSGKVVTQSFAFNNFDKVALQDIAGKVEVTIGKAFAIKVEIDDNLLTLLEVSEKDGKLTVKLANNKNNRLYIEDTRIRVHISMPEASVIENDANSDLLVRGIVGRYFRLENYGNGDAIINGTIDELEVTKGGNGNVNASGLSAKVAKVKASGNGDVTVNANQQFWVSGNGNGNVTNTGTARPDAGSRLRGNGEIYYKGGKHQE